MKVLVIVDMQNDFVNGVLGSEDAQVIVPNIVEKIEKCDGNTLVLFTKDTHQSNYLETQEGKNLPIPHCIEGTDGWCINKDIRKAWDSNDDLLRLLDSEFEFIFVKDSAVKKDTFGSISLAEIMLRYEDDIESVEFCGVCTDICIISNALLVKTYIKETPIIVDASCCAGLTKSKHESALDVMESCQIKVINREVK